MCKTIDKEQIKVEEQKTVETTKAGINSEPVKGGAENDAAGSGDGQVTGGADVTGMSETASQAIGQVPVPRPGTGKGKGAGTLETSAQAIGQVPAPGPGTGKGTGVKK